MNPELAYTGVDESRIGFHNDCMFFNWHDYGTYNGGTGFQSSFLDTLNLKPYLRDETRFVVYGGEHVRMVTILKTTQRVRWRTDSIRNGTDAFVLNSTYNHEVSDDWVEWVHRRNQPQTWIQI